MSTTHAGTGSPGVPKNSIVKVVFASLIGTAVEWYDFFLYGSAAALVFGTLFFPESDPVTATLLAFGTYALGFVARPLGGVVFGHFGDRVGRKKMLVVSLMMMGVATFAIGLLPTYATIGVAAPILLLVCRLVQGFAVGGEWGGAVLMAAEHGKDEQRGFWSSWPQAGVPLGNLLATGVLFVLAAFQSDAQFEAWGWRIPFLLSAVLVIIGLYVRLQLEESPVYKEAKALIAEKKDEASHMPILEVIKTYPKEVFIAMGMRMAENISYYIFTIVVLDLRQGVRQGGHRPDPADAADRCGLPVLPDPRARCALRPGGSSAAVPGRCRRRGRLVVLLLRARQLGERRQDPARRGGRTLLPLADVRPAGGVLLRAVRYVGPLHRCVGGLPARVDLRRGPGADHRGQAALHRRRRQHAGGRALRDGGLGDHGHRGAVRQGDAQQHAAARPGGPGCARAHRGPGPRPPDPSHTHEGPDLMVRAFVVEQGWWVSLRS